MTDLVNQRTGEMLSIPDATVTATALVLADDMSFDEWADLGGRLARVTEGVMWWVGDWWRYGERRYGERAAQALRSDRYSFQTFADAGWVAGAFETSRRREVLSWSHHKEVAALSRENPVVADGLLDLAEQNEWTRNDLRRQVKALNRRAQTATMASRAVEAPTGIDVRHQDCHDLIGSLPDGSASLLLTDLHVVDEHGHVYSRAEVD